MKFTDPIFTHTEIEQRVEQLGEQISKDYVNKQLTIVSIVTGGMFFTVDLSRAIKIPLRVDTINADSYHGQTTSGGIVHVRDDHNRDYSGQHVLLVDDILDTGRTMDTISNHLSDCGAESVRTCVFLDKLVDRAVEFEADYVGFECPDEFVVGYGLDFKGHYRNLPYIVSV